MGTRDKKGSHGWGKLFGTDISERETDRSLNLSNFFVHDQAVCNVVATDHNSITNGLGQLGSRHNSCHIDRPTRRLKKRANDLASKTQKQTRLKQRKILCCKHLSIHRHHVRQTPGRPESHTQMVLFLAAQDWMNESER